jgi:hypothetical protein
MPTPEETALAVDLHRAFLMVSEQINAPAFSVIHAALQLAANIGIDGCDMTDAKLHETLQHWIDFVRAAQGKGPKPNA